MTKNHQTVRRAGRTAEIRRHAKGSAAVNTAEPGAKALRDIRPSGEAFSFSEQINSKCRHLRDFLI